MESVTKSQVTQMITRAARGDESAVAMLLPVVYDALRTIAGGLFRQERSDHTLQPTALVNEAYIKLLGRADAEWDDRAHFLAVAAKAMRQILTDHARGKNAIKRGGGARERVTLFGLQTPAITSQIDLVALDDALAKLEEIDPRQCRIAELRFLAGLGVEDTAKVLGVSNATVKREWRMTRAWLRRELEGETTA